jgi:hypothetical protein
VKNLEGATSFGEFLLSDAGKRILETEDLNSIEPIIEGNIESVPPAIRSETVTSSNSHLIALITFLVILS